MRVVKTSKVFLKLIRILSWQRNAPCEMERIYIQTMVSGLVCVQLHREQFCLKEDIKSARFCTIWLRFVWHFHEMFLLLVGPKNKVMTVSKLKNVTGPSILAFCFVLHIWECRAIPTYRVYQLYDSILTGHNLIHVISYTWKFSTFINPKSPIPNHPMQCLLKQTSWKVESLMCL